MVSVSEASQKRPGLVPEDLQASIVELLEKCKEYVDMSNLLVFLSAADWSRNTVRYILYTVTHFYVCDVHVHTVR